MSGYASTNEHRLDVFHVKHEGWIEAAAAFDVVVDPRQASQLDTYEVLLR